MMYHMPPLYGYWKYTRTEVKEFYQQRMVKYD